MTLTSGAFTTEAGYKTFYYSTGGLSLGLGFLLLIWTKAHLLAILLLILGIVFIANAALADSNSAFL